MEIKSILFPTDFSEGSSQALQFAVDMAKRYGAKLYLLHVLYDITRATGWYVPHRSVDEMYKEIQQGAVKELDKFGIEELSSVKNIERIVETGVPHEQIIDFAKEDRSDNYRDPWQKRNRQDPFRQHRGAGSEIRPLSRAHGKTPNVLGQ